MHDKVINDHLLSSKSHPVLDSISNNDKTSKKSVVDLPTEKLASPSNLQSLPNKELVSKLNNLEMSCMEAKIQHENSWSLIETLLNQLKEKLLEINQELGHANHQLLSQEERIHLLENHVMKIISQPVVKPTTESSYEGETINKAENNQAVINEMQHQAKLLESIKLSISEIFAFNTNQKIIYDSLQANVNNLSIESQMAKESIHTIFSNINIIKHEDMVRLNERLSSSEKTLHLFGVSENNLGSLQKAPPNPLLDDYFLKEFEAKFDMLLSSKINESWGEHGLNTVIDDLKTDVILCNNELQNLKIEMNSIDRDRNRDREGPSKTLINDVMNHVDNLMTTRLKTTQDSLSILASAVLSLNEQREEDLNENHIYKTTPFSSLTFPLHQNNSPDISTKLKKIHRGSSSSLSPYSSPPPSPSSSSDLSSSILNFVRIVDFVNFKGKIMFSINISIFNFNFFKIYNSNLTNSNQLQMMHLVFPLSV